MNSATDLGSIDVPSLATMTVMPEPSSDSGALSLQPTSLSDEPMPSAQRPKGNVALRFLKRADLILVLLLVVGAVGLIVSTSLRKSHNGAQLNNATNNFKTQQIPLSGFIANEQGVSFGSSSVQINGSLKLNNGLIITPGVQPSTPASGQLYFDQNTDQLAYYNGTSFVPLSADTQVVKSINGITGAITLGGGLSVVGNQLVSSTGVTSIGGKTGAITVGSGLVITNNSLQSNGVISLVSGTPANLSVANDGNGNYTVSNVGSGSGTVTSSGGAVNGQIALFTTSQNIEASLLSQSGATVTVNGNLSVTGTLSLGTPLAVASGGTGASTLAANGVLIGNGGAAVTSAISGSPGLCLMSTAGAPTWGACPGSSPTGVTQLNGLTGALTLANASGSVNTITINDATTASKGIASFNSTNFTVVAGAVNVAQDITTSSTPTFTGVNTNSITPSGALTVGVPGQKITLQGNGLSTFAATSGVNTTTIGFSGAATGNVNYNFDQSATPGTYTVCTSAANCAGLGGAVTTSGGTTNRVAKFTGSNAVNDSSISDNGTNVTINGTTGLIIQGGVATLGDATHGGSLAISDGTSNTVTLIATNLSADRIYTLPDAGGNATLCIDSGNCIGGTGSAPNGAAYLVASLNGTLTNERALVAGANITTNDGGANGNLTVATVQNPSFTTSVTTPILQSSSGLTITSAAGQTIAVSAGTTIELQSNTNVTGSLDVSASFTSGSSNSFQVNSSGAIAAATGVTSSGAVTFSGLDCTPFANGGKVTTDGGGVLSCADDAGAGTNTISGTGTSGTIPLFNGLHSVTDSVLTQSGSAVTLTGTLTLTNALTVANGGTGAGTFTGNGVLYGNGTNALQVTSAGASGQVLVANGSGVPTFVTFSGDVAVSNTGAVTIQANSVALGTDTTGNYVDSLGALTGLSTTGNSGEGSTPTLSVLYGSGASTAVQGNTSITVSAGTNLTGGGAITLGSGGTVTLNVANSPTFSGTLTVQGASATVGTAAVQGSLILNDGSSNIGTFKTAALGQDTVYSLPDPGAGTATICLTSGNCAGTGGGVTTSGGTLNQLAKFTAGSAIGDSSISDNATNVTINGTTGFIVQGGSATLGDATHGGQLLVEDGAGNAVTIIAHSLAAGVTYTLPDVAGSADFCLSTGNCVGGGGGGAPNNANYLVTSLDGTLSNERALTAGANINFNDAGANGNFTVATIQNPSFTTSVTTPILQSSSGLTISSAAGQTVAVTAGTTIELQSNTNVTGALDVSAGLTAGASNSFQVNSSGAITAATGITSSGTIDFTGLNCTTFTNGGALTTDASGNLQCSNDDGGAGGAITGSGTSGTIPLFTGTSTIGDSVLTQSGSAVTLTGTLTLTNALTVANGGTGAGTFTTNGVLYGNGTGTLQVTGAGTGGQVLIANGSGVPTFATFSGDVAVSSTGAVTIQANSVALGTDTTGNYVDSLGTLTGLSTTGNSGEGSTPTLSVTYGSGANTAVQGNTSISVSAGTNLTGGGSITLGSGGTVTLNVANSPTFSGTLTVQGATATIGTAAVQGGLVLNDGSSNIGTVQTAALGQDTVYTIPDPGSGATSFCLTSGNCAAAGSAGGDLTGSFPNPTIAKLQGVTVTTSSVASGNILQYNGTAWVNQSLSGDVTLSSGAVATIATGAVTSGKILDNTIANADLASGSFGNITGVGTLTGLTVTGAANINTSGTANTAIGNGTGTFQVTSAGGLNVSTGGNLTGVSGITTSGGYTQSGSTANTFTGASSFTAAGTALSVTNNASIGGTLTVNTITPNAALTVGGVGQSFTLQGTDASVITATNGVNTTTIGFVTPTANTTIKFPALSAGTGYTVCTSSGNCAGVGSTLQTAYDNSTNPEIVVDGTRGALTVRDASSPIGANLLEVQNNGGSTTYFGVTVSGIAVTGTATASGNINSTGGALQTNSVTRVDNSGNLTNIGNLTTTGASTFSTTTGLLTIQGAGGLALGLATQTTSIVGGNSSTFVVGSGGNTTTLNFTAPSGANTITFPAASGTVQLTPGSGSYIQQVPGTTATNTIAPTANSVVALTVKGTTGTAAHVIDVYDSTGSPALQDYFDNTGSLNVSKLIQPTANNTIDLGLSATAFRTGYFGTSVITPSVASNGATALSVDAGGAAALNLGTGNANAVSISKSGVTTTINGAATVTQNLTANGNSLFQTTTNSTAAFQLQSANGSAVFVGDTTPLNTLIDNGNGSFEGTTSGWALLAGATGTQAPDTAQHYIGGSSLKVALTSTAVGDGVKYTPSSFSANTQYVLSFDIKQTAGTDLTTNWGFGYNNGSDHSCTPSPSLSSQSVTASMTGWVRFSCSFTTAASPAPTYLYWKETDAPALARTFYLDAVQFEQVSTGIAQPFTNSKLQLNGVVTSPSVFQNITDSTTAFQIQNAAASTSIFTADTLNSKAIFGNMVGNTITSAAQVLVQAASGKRALALEAGDTSTDILDFYCNAGSSVGGFSFNGALSVTGSNSGGCTGGATITVGSTANSIAGQLNIDDANGHQLSITTAPNIANTHTIQLDTSLLTATRAYTFPDAAGTICLSTGNCSGANGYIQNQSASPQTANYNIIGTGTTVSAAKITQVASAGVGGHGLLVVGASGAGDSAFEVQNSSNAQAFTVQTNPNRVSVGSTGAGACTTGRFCVAQNITSTAGPSTSVNSYNIQSLDNSNTVGNFDLQNQKIVVSDTSGLSGNTIEGVVVDTTGTTDASTVVTSYQANVTSSTQPGNFLQMQANGVDMFDLSNAGIYTQTTTATTDAHTINLKNTSGTQTNGVFVNRNASGGTTTNGLNITNTLGTTTNAINITQSGGTLTTGVLFNGTLGGDGIQFTGTTVQDIANTGSNALTLFGTNGVTVTAASGKTISLDDNTAASGTVSIGAANAATVNLGNGNATTTNLFGGTAINIGTTGAAAQTITVGLTTQTGTLTLGQSTATNIINIGSANPSTTNTQTINIGNGGGQSTANSIAVNILSGAAGTNGTATLSLANNDRVTQVDVGNVDADASRTLNLFSGNTLTGNTDTLNIGTGNTAGTGAKVIHIGDGTPAGTNSVTIGSIAATANTTLIQGGNGATAVSMQAATSGTILIATTNTNTLTIGTTAGAITVAGNSIRIGDSTNNMTFSSTYEPTLNGTARHTRSVTFSAEYPGAVLSADTTSNSGTMTSDNTQASGTSFRNYYKWATTQGTAQDYDVWVKWLVPSDFSGWPTGQTVCLDVFASASSTNLVNMTVYGTDNNAVVTSADLSPLSVTTWGNKCTASITGGVFTAGSVATIDIKMTAPATTGIVEVGDITFNYLSKY
ncbi:MAG TPA: hypothetical protein VLH84_01440 [Patescibacteria group bacterium]|nr:hypothetical protein [Patescibacteria group bacterium]